MPKGIVVLIFFLSEKINYVCTLGWARIQIFGRINRIHSSWTRGGPHEHFEPNWRSVAYSTKQQTASKFWARSTGGRFFEVVKLS